MYININCHLYAYLSDTCLLQFARVMPQRDAFPRVNEANIEIFKNNQSSYIYYAVDVVNSKYQLST